METCSRTLHALPLLRPGHDPDEILLGCLGRAAEYYEVDIYGFGFCSTHVHLLHHAEHGLQMSRFQGHFNSNESGADYTRFTRDCVGLLPVLPGDPPPPSPLGPRV